MATAGMKCIQDKMIIFCREMYTKCEDEFLERRHCFRTVLLATLPVTESDTLADFCQVWLRLVCTQLLSNEWSHESVVLLLGSSLFCIEVKNTSFSALSHSYATDDVKHLLFLSNSERFLATYGCYTSMSSSQQQLDHAPHLLDLVKYMSRRR
jgi:hypothetical protein